MTERAALPALSEHRRLRFFTFGALYAAQGVPEGLLYVAIPAWLAERGVGAGAIGAFIGVILIPWSLKLVNGAVMDRWAFLAMGRRRPWVLAAQSGLIVALLALTTIDEPVTSLVLLTVIGVAINTFGAFQDVAVDGMAIDIIPPSDHARTNGVMWGSKTLGIAGSSAMSGWLLNSYGWNAAAIGIAGIVAVVMALPLLLRERPGERLFPWSRGAAAIESVTRHLGGWLQIARHLLRVTLTRQSLWLIAAIFVSLSSYGLFISAMPVFAVQALGWRSTEFTDIAATANLVGGVFGIVVGGSVADKFRPVPTLLFSLGLIALLHGFMAAFPAGWEWRSTITTYIIIHQILFVQMSVSIYALAMQSSDKFIAATHFAFFMAFVNLGTSAGASALGMLREPFGFRGVIGAMAIFSVAAIFIFRRVRS